MYCKLYLNFIFKNFSIQSGNFQRYFSHWRVFEFNSLNNTNLNKYQNVSVCVWRNMYPFDLNVNFFCTAQGKGNELMCPLEVISNELSTDLLVPRSLRVAGMAHQIFIIQPIIKWGKGKHKDVTAEMLCDEAESLIKTLHKWTVIETKKISLLSFDKKQFFNKGQLESLTDHIRNNFLITGVFINVTSLRLDQHLFLEKIFNVPIFDRYSIIINIFKQHAVTKEAKLQVALAEIPYVRSRIRGANESESNTFITNTAIGSSESHSVNRLKFLSEHERKIKKSIENLRKNRELLRIKRKTLQFPLIAVIGYTNAGKTSLIKCLTKEEKMKPEDKLFATLDITVHKGCLPSNQKVLYIDTIGFISDIPTNLLEPFVATLEDAIQADIIIHVQDISHPNSVVQASLVLETLKSFNLKPQIMENIITVGNKCDKVTENKTKYKDDIIFVSCLKQTGLTQVELKVEETLCRVLDMLKIRMRVPNGGQEYWWLQKETAVFDIIVDEKNQQYVFLDVLISKIKFEKFKKQFVRR